jgi:hypothetical protein
MFSAVRTLAKHPLVEAAILALVWLLNVVYGVADPLALYGKF